ncbi:MAG: hypothetical protein KC978_17135 [Candidatus Omnitrophica bacterium]|nr:hypothetical protein [Candidatus Omnitrophota bacterium]
MSTDQPPVSYSEQRNSLRTFAGIGILVLVLLSGFWVYRQSRWPELPREYEILDLSNGEGMRIAEPRDLSERGDIVGSGWIQSGTGEARAGLAYVGDNAYLAVPGIWYPTHIDEDRLIDGYTGATPYVAIRAKIVGEKVLRATGEWLDLPGSKLFFAGNGHGDSVLRASEEFYLVDANGHYQEMLLPETDSSKNGSNRLIYFSDINEKQIVVGGEFGPDTRSNEGLIWSVTGGLRVPEIYDASRQCNLMSINDSNVCVGLFKADHGEGIFFWNESEKLIDEYLDHYLNLRPIKINNRNQVVGLFCESNLGREGVPIQMLRLNLLERLWRKFLSLFPSTSVSRFYPESTPEFVANAFLYENGILYDLNAAIPWGSEWDRLLYAIDINDRGQIIGVGLIDGHERGFLMTPVEGGL